MKRVYVILEKNIIENTTNVYGIYSDKMKEWVKKKVDELNRQSTDDVQDSEVDYIIEPHDIIEKKEELSIDEL